LDMPEVSLVAVFDADKAGFLRSERSLIQSIGRAARHIHGQAIFYADTITDAIQKAITETQRRRTKQIAYNKKHSIIPRGIEKAITDILEGAIHEVPANEPYAKVAEKGAEYAVLSPDKLDKKIKQLQKQMYQHAENLEFEAAAKLRDEIEGLQANRLEIS
ncbi:MAG: UvrB/UvrC motif-containing protein, partial [Candidatus Parabeggiatoa sp.]|nr:UvrB/UvrC motif-containing protein [Candidatus Parabeggiatoa sp.]